MLSPRWRKVLRDLWGNKTRTILIVLSIAVGIFAIGMIAGTQVTLSNDLTNAYMAVNPASSSLYTDAFDDELLHTVQAMPEVAEATGRRTITVRLMTGPDQWKSLSVLAIPDYDDIKMNIVRPQTGVWPPPNKSILIERGSLEYLGLTVGGTAVVETSDGKRHTLQVAGTCHDLTQTPAVFANQGYGYVTLDTIEWLGAPRYYNELNILVAENGLDKAHIQQVTDEVRAKVEKSGRTVYYTSVPEPGKHPVDAEFQAFLLLLGILGVLSLFLSGFLVVNTISALLTQQVRQIGIMKAVGARANQITGMYLGMVFGFGVLALLIGVPLGALGALAVGGYVGVLLNFDLPGFSLPIQILLLEVGVGILVPILAALYPILAGTHITAREAITQNGIDQGVKGSGRIDRVIGRVRGLSRPMLLSLRNTFRRKGRLALTLATLILGGAIFIAVFSVRDSAYLTLDDALRYYNFDVAVDFGRFYNDELLEQKALETPGVTEAKTIIGGSARRVRPDGVDGSTSTILALDPTSDLIVPTLIEGRWLIEGDENAIVINTEVQKTEPDIGLGSTVVMKIEGKETSWQVVGIVRGVATGRIAYATKDYFSRVTRDVDRAGSVWVVTAQHDAESERQVAQSLEANYEANGIRVSTTETISNLRATVKAQFDIIIVFLLIMAVLLAVVGGLGLMGTMSLNVLERRREIGVMRAIGAADGEVRRIFIVEGVLIGILSWLVGSVLALPLSRLMSDGVGMAFMKAPLSFTFSFQGAVIWLVIVIVLSLLASILPARSASKVSVREVLAYE